MLKTSLNTYQDTNQHFKGTKHKKRPASNVSGVIEISDDEISKERPNKRRIVIEISDGEDNSENKSPVKLEHTHNANPTVPTSANVLGHGELNLSQDSNGKIKVTKKERVDVVEELDRVPARWPVSNDNVTAYVLDLDQDARTISNVTKQGKVKALDTFLKSEVRRWSLS